MHTRAHTHTHTQGMGGRKKRGGRGGGGTEGLVPWVVFHEVFISCEPVHTDCQEMFFLFSFIGGENMIYALRAKQLPQTVAHLLIRVPDGEGPYDASSCVAGHFPPKSH